LRDVLQVFKVVPESVTGQIMYISGSVDPIPGGSPEEHHTVTEETGPDQEKSDTSSIPWINPERISLVLQIRNMPTSSVNRGHDCCIGKHEENRYQNWDLLHEWQWSSLSR
jgi:hypothetical protein